MTLAKLQMLHSRQVEIEHLESHVRALPGPLRILEAGCGRQWPLNLQRSDYRLTGIDLDVHALNSRMHRRGDLHEAIVGDLCAKGMIPDGAYDVVYSSFVLEHIQDAESALRNMVGGLKHGGMLLLRIPDRFSVYGWAARITPFRLHVAYRRYVLGDANAGKPGHSPYPTYHASVVSRRGIRAFCETHGCEVMREYGLAYYLQRENLRTLAVKVAVLAVWALSLGRLAWRHNNLTYVIRKK